LGTVSGPLVGGALMQVAGPSGLLWFMTLTFAFYGGYAAWRMARRKVGEGRIEKSDFQAMPIPLRGTDPGGRVIPTSGDQAI